MKIFFALRVSSKEEKEKSGKMVVQMLRKRDKRKTQVTDTSTTCVLQK